MGVKKTAYHWYRLFGRTAQDDVQPEVATTFVYLVQSASKRNVIKRYGGSHKCMNHLGNFVRADFTKNQNAVEQLPEGWDPQKIAVTEMYMAKEHMVIRMFPLSVYSCACGTDHYSEYPYPSMWCHCGQKAPRNGENTALSRPVMITPANE